MAATALGARLTREQRRDQLGIRALALKEVVSAWSLLDPRDIDRTAGAWLKLMLGLTKSHHRLSVLSGARYYLDLRAVETGHADIPKLPAARFEERAALNSLTVTGPVGIKRRLAHGMPPEQAAKLALVETSGALGRHVLNGGRDTVVEHAAADPVAVGFARVAGPGCCPFCALLASRGFAYKSRETALFVGGTQRRYHDHCACSEEATFDRDAPLPDGAAEFERIYAQSTGGLSGQAARSAFAAALREQRAG